MLIPAFSIGRTQELLYEFEQIIAKNQHNAIWQQIDIIVDSPLAASFNAVYHQLKDFWDQDAKQRLASGRHPLQFEQLLTVKSHEDHQKVVRHLAETARRRALYPVSGNSV